MKHKPRRTQFPLDKVAMVSLPLALLMFLLMIVRPRTWFTSSVDLPTATFRVTETEGEYVHILLRNGICAIAIDSVLRAQTLIDMAKKHAVKLNAQQVYKFSKMPVFGAAMSKMPTFINSHSSNSEVIDSHFGIPIDIKNDELSEWINIASVHNYQLNARKLKVALLCDKNEPYTNIKLIRDALKKDSINRVAVIYTPRF